MTVQKQCSKCNKQLPLSSFYQRKASKDGLMYKCKDCCKAKNRENYVRDSTRNREIVLEYLKKNSCKHCGEKNVMVLDFNHLGNKTYNISDLIGRGYSEKTLRNEMAKCEVLCANCHRKYTAKQQNSYRYIYEKSLMDRAKALR